MKKSELRQIIREEIQKENFIKNLFKSKEEKDWDKFAKKYNLSKEDLDGLAYNIGYGIFGNLKKQPPQDIIAKSKTNTSIGPAFKKIGIDINI
jgi:hypothetical protein